jgi:hypothetical protein
MHRATTKKYIEQHKKCIEQQQKIHRTTQKIHRTTQKMHRATQKIHRATNKLGRVRAVPRLCGHHPGICLTTEGKARKNLSQGSHS